MPIDRWFRALRHGSRSLARTPRLTLAALASTALGIGSAVFMLTLIDAVLLRRPPFPEADRLVRIWTVSAETGGHSDLSYLEFRDVERQAKSFEALEMAARTRLAVETADGTERMRGESVTPGYFALIGLEPALGRSSLPRSTRPTATARSSSPTRCGNASTGAGRTSSARWSGRAAPTRAGSRSSSTPWSASCPPASPAPSIRTSPTSGSRPRTLRRARSSRAEARGTSGRSPA